MLGKILSSILLLFVIYALSSGGAFGQMITMPSDTGLGGNGSISGSIRSSTGTRIERNITIRLRTPTRGDRLATADESGNFIFRGLPSGDYTVVIDKEDDFEPYTQSVSLVQVRGFPPSNYPLVIRLVPKVNVQPKPAVVDAAFAALPDRAKELYRGAQESSKAGDHKAAIEQLTALTAEYPRFMNGFNELGVVYLRVNQPAKADEAFIAALKVEPEAFAPAMNRGIALVTMRRFADAEPVLREAKKRDENSGVVRYFLGQALANLGKFDEAEKELTASLSLGGPEFREAHRILAIIYSSKGEKKKAASHLETYLELSPKAADAEKLREVIKQLKGEGQPGASPEKTPRQP